MVKLRLRRTGKKKQPSYQIIAIDSHKKRQGNYLEKVGHYFPLSNKYDIDQEKVLKWLSLGAQPTLTVKNILVKNKIIEIFAKKKLSLKKDKLETISKTKTFPEKPVSSD